ncbi:putative protein kinase RLK-Pelle-WAK-LRK10L-1 family [Helianthus debilis subsp. tardiflorus]
MCTWIYPEYATTYRLKKASDIYSFGVVLCEIFTGTLAYDWKYIRENTKGLAHIAQVHFERGTQKEILDPKLIDEAHELISSIKIGPDDESLNAFSKIASQCLAKTQAARPTIEDVIKELTKALKFQEASEIWEAKLPRNYKDILQFSKSPETYSTMAKKDIYNILSKGILLQDDKRWFSIGDHGEMNEMVSARMFSFKNSWSHRWRSTQESRFHVKTRHRKLRKVAEMLDISNLNIQINIGSQFLPVDVRYSVHLVFKFCGPRKSHAKRVYVDLKYKMGNQSLHAYFATRREDDWMMIELCRFSNLEKDSNFEVLLEGF